MYISSCLYAAIERSDRCSSVFLFLCWMSLTESWFPGPKMSTMEQSEKLDDKSVPSLSGWQTNRMGRRVEVPWSSSTIT